MGKTALEILSDQIKELQRVVGRQGRRIEALEQSNSFYELRLRHLERYDLPAPDDEQPAYFH